MQAVTQRTESLSISREKLASFIKHMFGGVNVGREDDEHPLPPGPWDPIIRKVAKKVFGPQPEPWRLEFSDPSIRQSAATTNRLILGIIAARHPEIFDVVGGGRLTESALNPQPLPPRAMFLAAFAEEAIDRVLLTQEIAETLNRSGEQQDINIAGGRLSFLVDELCGNNFKVRIPFPRPKHDDDELLSGIDLLAVAAVFEQNAATIAHEGLSHVLRKGVDKLIETGVSRM